MYKIKDEIIKRGKEVGFSQVGVTTCEKMREAALPLSSLRGGRETPYPQEKESGSIVMAALPYYTPPHTPPPPDVAVIAPFAAGNYYKAAVSAMKRVALTVRELTGLKKRSIRIFCNSSLYPEKSLAILSQVGFPGRNGLVITPQFGSRVVLVGMRLPIELEPDTPIEKSSCSGCTRCLKACPVKAIGEHGITPSLCLQRAMGEAGLLPEESMERWRQTLYGCDECQNCCPYNSKIPPVEPLNKMEPGGSLELERLLGESERDFSRLFHSTTLGQRWIPVNALRRNALLSAKESQSPKIGALIKGYLEHSEWYIRETARWVIKKSNRF